MRKPSKAIEQIAIQEGVPVREVYNSIQAAIEIGFNNPDPEVQATWSKISKNGKIPTPEEVIKFCARQAKREGRMPQLGIPLFQ